MEKTRNASQSVMERASKTLAVADVRKVVMKATETQNTPPSAATCGYAAPNSLSKNLEIRAFDPSRLLFLMREISRTDTGKHSNFSTRGFLATVDCT